MSHPNEIHRGDELAVKEAGPKVARPPLFRVLLLNDDFTPMDFVVELVQRIFSKSHDQAVKVMLEVHEKGAGSCGIYPHEIAEMKVRQVLNAARENEHPLQSTLEPE